MDLQSLSLFQSMTQKMKWDSARHTVISQNIANADTPNYTPKDLKPFALKSESLELAAPLPMVLTSTRHLLAGGSSTIPIEEKSKNYYETAPDGNKVSLEEQTTKLADTAIDYQTMTNLYRKHISMLKMAAGRSGAA